MFLDISQNSQENTCARVFSSEFCEISNNTFFHRTPLVGISQFQQGMLLYISPILKNLCNVLKAHFEIGLDHRDIIEIVGKVKFAIISKI